MNNKRIRELALTPGGNSTGVSLRSLLSSTTSWSSTSRGHEDDEPRPRREFNLARPPPPKTGVECSPPLLPHAPRPRPLAPRPRPLDPRPRATEESPKTSPERSKPVKLPHAHQTPFGSSDRGPLNKPLHGWVAPTGGAEGKTRSRCKTERAGGAG